MGVLSSGRSGDSPQEAAPPVAVAAAPVIVAALAAVGVAVAVAGTGYGAAAVAAAVAADVAVAADAVAARSVAAAVAAYGAAAALAAAAGAAGGPYYEQRPWPAATLGAWVPLQVSAGWQPRAREETDTSADWRLPSLHFAAAAEAGCLPEAAEKAQRLGSAEPAAGSGPMPARGAVA